MQNRVSLNANVALVYTGFNTWTTSSSSDKSSSRTVQAFYKKNSATRVPCANILYLYYISFTRGRHNVVRFKVKF